VPADEVAYFNAAADIDGLPGDELLFMTDDALKAYTKVLREGMGSAQDIGRAVCLQGREADEDGPEIVSAY